MPDQPAAPAPWRVAILGPGGVGGLLAVLLARLGDEVTCVAPPATAEHLEAHGIELRSGRYGDGHAGVRATTHLGGPGTAYDACLVTVKATRLGEALAQAPAAALGGALVVPFLNGLDHMAELRRHYPAEQVVAATIRVESTRVAPGVIEHGSPFAAVELASATAGPARVKALADHLAAAGLDVATRDDEPATLWSKLLVLAPLALLTTHAAAPFGEVAASRLDELAAVAHEVAAAARAADGVELDAGATVRLLERVPAGMRSSMQRDAEAGRPLELDAIGGAVLRAAARGGIAVPVTERLVADLAARHPG